MTKVTTKLNMLQLAIKLGVDRATISRALSDDKSHLVAAATRERIRREALEAGYRPNLTAAALRKGRSQTVGVLASDLGNEMIIDVIRAIVAHLDGGKTGSSPTPLIAETRDEPGAAERMIHTFLSRGVDAILNLASTEVDQDILLEAAKEVPVVLAVRSLESVDFPSSLCNDERGGALVAEHFSKRGHKVVCQIQGPPLAATFIRRAEGFSKVCQSAGMIEQPQHLTTEMATSAAGKEMLDPILTVSPRPTAVFAHNDALALGLIEAMRLREMKYPDDIAIAGFNDTQTARILARPLTTVRYPVDDVSRYAGYLVRSVMEGEQENLGSRSFAPSLFARAST